MKNIYHIEHGISKLSDGRKNPKYKTSQVIIPLLLGFMLQIKSMNELKLMLYENEFRDVFPRNISLPQIDTIRDALFKTSISLSYWCINYLKEVNS
jgi:hypothetical protein